MIDGITVMMVTQNLKLLRDQVRRREPHSTIGVPDHLATMAVECRALAEEISRLLNEKEAAA